MPLPSRDPSPTDRRLPPPNPFQSYVYACALCSPQAHAAPSCPCHRSRRLPCRAGDFPATRSRAGDGRPVARARKSRCRPPARRRARQLSQSGSGAKARTPSPHSPPPLSLARSLSSPLSFSLPPPRSHSVRARAHPPRLCAARSRGGKKA
eukprot:6214339-Pleurochrysis_carterae.AAC.1